MQEVAAASSPSPYLPGLDSTDWDSSAPVPASVFSLGQQDENKDESKDENKAKGCPHSHCVPGLCCHWGSSSICAPAQELILSLAHSGVLQTQSPSTPQNPQN